MVPCFLLKPHNLFNDHKLRNGTTHPLVKAINFICRIYPLYKSSVSSQPPVIESTTTKKAGTPIVPPPTLSHPKKVNEFLDWATENERRTELVRIAKDALNSDRENLQASGTWIRGGTKVGWDNPLSCPSSVATTRKSLGWDKNTLLYRA